MSILDLLQNFCNTNSVPDQKKPVAVTLSVAGAAAATGLSPATVRTWDHRYGLSPSIRTSGGHRRYSQLDVLRLRLAADLVDSGVPPSSAVPTVRDWTERECNRHARRQTSHAGSPPTSDDYQRYRASILRDSRALNSDQVRADTRQLVTQAGTVDAWNEVLEPTLVEIGKLWQSGQIGVDAEHVASKGIAEALGERQGDGLDERPILLACAPEELHTLPMLALRSALRERGLQVADLGDRVPPDALASAVKRLRPRAIVVWASTDQSAANVDFSLIPGQRPASHLFVAGPGWRDTRLAPGVQQLSSLTQAVDELTDLRRT